MFLKWQRVVGGGGLLSERHCWGDYEDQKPQNNNAATRLLAVQTSLFMAFQGNGKGLCDSRQVDDKVCNELSEQNHEDRFR